MPFVILSLKHSPGHGGAALWWGRNRCGYTADLDAAGKYTKAEAKDICDLDHVGHPTSVAIEIGAAAQLSMRSVEWGDTRHFWPDAGGGSA